MSNPVGAKLDCLARSRLHAHQPRQKEVSSPVSAQTAIADSAAADSSSKRRPPRTLYRGDPGMWAWVLHRITGATIFFFLFVHVLDAAVLRVSPQAYNDVLATYKTPIIGLMEFGLIAAVLFHSLNGIRIMLIDFWSEGPRHQRTMLWVVCATFLILLTMAGVVTGIHMWERFA
ncbi:succinate dehydrogenase, cytochrome b556 subunit [Mycobacterium sp.]|uniref:succinate dehydrogenase, cytochrome b556 subunit n=1 Tax=Mycobacterium sp. TaxID=1785 RepID=UPI003A87B7FC